MKKVLLSFLLGLLGTSLLSCSLLTRSQLNSFYSWGYQTNSYRPPYSLHRIYETKDMLWVIDYSKDKSDKGRFLDRELTPIKTNGNILLAEINISEASEYRYFFKDLEPKLFPYARKTWATEHPVKYWESDWQNIFLKHSKTFGSPYLERIIKANFDGIVLEGLEAFGLYSDKIEYANKMIDFVLRISNIMKKGRPGFIILIKNASEIINYTTRGEIFLDAIDGIITESSLFFGDQQKNNQFNPLVSTHKNLKFFKKFDKPVFSIEYLDDPALLKNYRKEAEARGYIPLATDRKHSGEMVFHKDL